MINTRRALKRSLPRIQKPMTYDFYHGWLVYLLCLTQLSTIFQLFQGDLFYWWRKPEKPEKTCRFIT